MKIYALWHGGCSYMPGNFEHIETFPSIAEAKRELSRREHSRGPHWFEYVNKPEEHVETPCVEGSEMWLWASMPQDDGDLYPGSILSFGPRGGIREQSG